MTTFSKILVSCPHCKCIMYEYELMSYTIHKAIYFSDGKNESGSFAIPGRRIGICQNCNLPFWKEDARCELDPYDEKFNDVPEVKDLFDHSSMLSDRFELEKISFFQKLVEDGFANTRERKLYLREQLWWAINDLIRYAASLTQFIKLRHITFNQMKRLWKSRKQSKRDFASFNSLFLLNLEKLAGLLVKFDDSDLLFLAEVYRELGRFQMAKSVLRSVPEKSGKTYKQIKRAIAWRRKRVFEIN